jgi:hypothetical protein
MSQFPPVRSAKPPPNCAWACNDRLQQGQARYQRQCPCDAILQPQEERGGKGGA